MAAQALQESGGCAELTVSECPGAPHTTPWLTLASQSVWTTFDRVGGAYSLTVPRSSSTSYETPSRKS